MRFPPIRFSALVVVLVTSCATLLNAQVSWDGASTSPNNNLWSNDANWNPDGTPSGQAVAFDNTDVVTSSLTPNSIVDQDITIDSLTFIETGSANWQVVQINSGVTLTLNTNEGVAPTNILAVGTQASSSTDIYSNAKITGSGSLVINESSSNIFISNSSTNASGTATLDLSGLSSFSAVAANLYVGNGSRSNGVLSLADTNNLKLDVLSVGRNPSSDQSGNGSFLNLGRVNTINADDIFVGAPYLTETNASGGTMRFQSFAAGITPTVTIRGKESTTEAPTRADLTVGSQGGPTTQRTSVTALVDFTGGYVDALLGDVIIADGRALYTDGSKAGRLVGTLSMGNGIIDTRSIVIGRTNTNSHASPNTGAIGNLNVTGGRFTTGSMIIANNAAGSEIVSGNLNIYSGGTVELLQSIDGVGTSGNITLGTKSGAASAVTATINLYGNGLLKVGGNIAEGSTPAGVTSILNLKGGILDMDGGNLSVDAFNVQGGTLKNVASYKDGSGTTDQVLAKTGNGTVRLTGTNSYVGGATVTGGVLLADAGALPSTGTINVSTGGALTLNFSNIQSTLNTRVNTASTGAIALNWNNAADNIDFSVATGAGLTSAYLGAYGDVTYTGTHTTATAGTYRLGGGTGVLNYTGNISNSDSVIIGGGPGTVILSGTNDYTGGTTLLSGILRLTSLDDIGATSNQLNFDGGTLQWGPALTSDISTDRTVSIASGGAVLDTNGNNVTLASAIGNSGLGGLTKYGSGTLTLQGLNTFSGPLGVATGTLALDLSTNSGGVVNSTSALNLSGGTLQVKGASSGSSSQTLGNVSLTGANRIVLDANGGAGTTLTLGPTWTRNAGSTVAVTLGANTTLASTVSELTLQNGILPYLTLTNTTETGFGTISGGNIVAYSGYTTITGATSSLASGSVAAGLVNFKIAGGATNISAVDASNVAYMNSLLMTDSASHQVSVGTNRTIRLSGTGAIFLAAGAGNLTIGGTSQTTSLTAGGSSGNVAGEVILINQSANTLTLNSQLANNGTGVVSVTKSGSGLVVFASSTNSGGTTSISSYTGATTINEGTISLTRLFNGGVNSDLGASTNAASNLIFNGGTLRYTGAGSSTDRLFTLGLNGGTIEASGSGAVNFTNNDSIGYLGNGARTLTLSGTSTAANTLYTWIGDNGGSTSVAKTGAGKWIIGGYNDYSGATRVTAGTLIVNGAIGGGSAVSVENASTVLGGNGTINGSVTIGSGATLSPGDGSTATLSTGSVTLASTSNVAMTLAGAVASAGHDQINVTGLIDLGSGANINITLAYAPVEGQLFTLIANDASDAISGAFATINGAAFGVGNTFTLTYNSVTYDAQLFYTGSDGATFGGNDLVVQVVPEPSTIALLATGLLGAVFMARRKRVNR